PCPRPTAGATSRGSSRGSPAAAKSLTDKKSPGNGHQTIPGACPREGTAHTTTPTPTSRHSHLPSVGPSRNYAESVGSCIHNPHSDRPVRQVPHVHVPADGWRGDPIPACPSGRVSGLAGRTSREPRRRMIASMPTDRLIPPTRPARP